MLGRPRLISAVSILTIAVGCMAGGSMLPELRTGSDRAALQHSAFHLSCPPGSHGRPRYQRFGEILGFRRVVRSERAPEAPLPLASRAVTLHSVAGLSGSR